ncbi:hypothetical protein ACIPY5_00225 [Microbacterium sp. NPDC089698]|uniref:hypothetical protein n=1 Tax=Microbacterium sp. NPDC089698 TaxID=3364200 RepID=UPI00381C1967
MVELTGYVSLRAIHEVVVEETTRLVQTWRTGTRAQPEPIPRQWIVGTGARHAFGSKMGRFRIVESLATDDSAGGATLEASTAFLEAMDAMTPAEFEWINLVGVDKSHDIKGIDYRPSHRDGDEWVQAQETVRQFASAPGADESLLYRSLILTRLQDVFDQLGPDAVSRNELDEWFSSAVDGTAFITSLSVQRVVAELLYAAHRNRGYAFRQHDRIDVHDLALAVPYCDVVVPDSHWAHLAQASRVAGEYGTLVVRGQKALRDWVEGL